MLLVIIAIIANITTIADYGYKSAFVADQEINLVACLIDVMANCEFE